VVGGVGDRANPRHAAAYYKITPDAVSGLDKMRNVLKLSNSKVRRALSREQVRTTRKWKNGRDGKSSAVQVKVR